jgi:hypothetical protein
MEYLFDEPCDHQLVDLLAYSSALFFVESTQRLFHGSGSSSDIQRVLGDIPRYAGHIRGTPCKHLGIRAEKVDEHCFLFGVELGADPDLLAGIVAGVKGDGLDRLHRFEVAGVAFRIGHLFGEAHQVGDEGLGFGEGLGVFHALHITFVCVTVHGADGDDPVGARHLELEVGVVGDDHELGVAWSPQHRVVGSSETDHLEREGFLSEVGGSPEADGQIELSKGLDALPRDDPVKGRRTGPDCGQIDLQELEGLGVDDVEAAASIHEDLGESDVADDGIDNKRVLSWARHTVGVVKGKCALGSFLSILVIKCQHKWTYAK